MSWECKRNLGETATKFIEILDAAFFVSYHISRSLCIFYLAWVASIVFGSIVSVLLLFAILSVYISRGLYLICTVFVLAFRERLLLLLLSFFSDLLVRFHSFSLSDWEYSGK